MRNRIFDRILSIRPCNKGLILSMLIAATLFGCGKYEGSVNSNQAPDVDFATTPLDSTQFSASPVVSWFGTDPDGFVEYYSYADIVDPVSLADVGAPQRYIDNKMIPQDAWTRTSSTSDTIVLRTSEGDTTRHVLYLKATDDKGLDSKIKYRIFDRSNQPPNPPEIKNPTTDEWKSRLELPDTMYCIENVTTLWTGINFNWKASDPDSKIGQNIPLSYKYYLIKAPNDTIRRYVTTGWITTKTLTITGLETGSYRFEVYSRDDGMTTSRAPGVCYFTVIKPTFDKNIMIYMEANTSNTGFTYARLIPDTAKAYYKNLLQTIRTSYPQFRNLRYDVNNDEDVKFVVLDSERVRDIPSMMQLSRYRLVLWMQDAGYNSARLFSGIRLQRFNKYLNVGGRMLVSGRLLSVNQLSVPAAADTVYRVQRNEFFTNYMGCQLVDDPVTRASTKPDTSEFRAAISQVGGLSNLTFDSTIFFDQSKYYNRRVYPANTQWRGCPGVDYLSTTSARTLYTFMSATEDTVFYPTHYTGEHSTVIERRDATIGGQTISYPPTPTNCLIQIIRDGDITSMTRVENITKRNLDPNSNWRGSVRSITGSYAFITYQYGEPWMASDTLEVDYSYRATSPRTGKPICTSNEISMTYGNTTVSVLLTRTVFCSFPFYFQHQAEVPQNFGYLLNWLLGSPSDNL